MIVYFAISFRNMFWRISLLISIPALFIGLNVSVFCQYSTFIIILNDVNASEQSRCDVMHHLEDLITVLHFEISYDVFQLMWVFQDLFFEIYLFYLFGRLKTVNECGYICSNSTFYNNNLKSRFLSEIKWKYNYYIYVY